MEKFCSTIEACQCQSWDAYELNISLYFSDPLFAQAEVTAHTNLTRTDTKYLQSHMQPAQIAPDLFCQCMVHVKLTCASMIFCLESTTACMSEWSFLSSSSTDINLQKGQIWVKSNKLQKSRLNKKCLFNPFRSHDNMLAKNVIRSVVVSVGLLARIYSLEESSICDSFRLFAKH